jgi:hypothetical protein
MLEQDAMTTTPMTPTTTTTTTAMPDNWLEALPCDLSRYIMDLTVITIDELVEEVYGSVVHNSLSYTVDQEELDEIIADNETAYSIDYDCSVQNSIKDVMSQQPQRVLTVMLDKHFKNKHDAIDYINDEEHGYQDTLYEYDSPECDSPFLFDYKMVALGIKVYERYMEVVKGCYDLDNVIKIYDDEEGPDWYEYSLMTTVARR